MRRRSTTFFILGIFLVWNVMTYVFIAHNRQATKATDGEEPQQTGRKFAELEARLKQQAAVHERLLYQLEEVRRDLHRELLHKAVANAKDKNVKTVAPQRPGRPNSTGGPKPGAKLQQVDSELGNISNEDLDKVKLPVLVIACNRPTIRRNLDQLIKYRPSADRFPIVVSQDCGHGPTADVIRSYGDQVTHVQHPDLSEPELKGKQKNFKGYYKIARHYKWALQQIFYPYKYETVIVVEDDLDISPDFFEYFAATFRVLRTDPSLWCVSAWNDNGKASYIDTNSPELLYRTDFFPGLGWMMEKKIWLELEDKWPITFWDDWMRHPDQRKGRSCIRPEISRTSTFGKQGVSKGQYFEKHLKFIKLNDIYVPFTSQDVSYLRKEKYDENFAKTVYSAPLLNVLEVVRGEMLYLRVVRVEYRDKQGFKTQAKQLGIMDDLKSGVARGAYRGIVSFMYKTRRVYLAPPPDWKEYNPLWS